MSAKPKPIAKMNIGELAEEHQRLSDAYDALEDQQKALVADMDKLALESIVRLKSAGQAKGATASVEFGWEEKEHFNISDFAALTKFMAKSGHFELLQRRVSSTAYVELREAKVKVPGISIFRKDVFKTKRRKTHG